ncbi:ABC transporter permease [Natrarchaeobius chitinivorans]|uniref:ABC transporter permease n=1 Tax=Natrarchaeobius chitinivorans TaxID=1679083 RepID=A0A3N6M330_NATCH|nr:ABC transporter permease [Natrarchaeobius chitinivorans]RQG94844.1 ABC transporter permease [Natrarchaeobius chitinivorans]
MSILSYAAKRLFVSIWVLFGASILIFGIVHLVPGDPARVTLGRFADREAVEGVRQEMGLNDPLYVQYSDWLVGTLTGDWGNSLISNQPVLTLIVERFPKSIELALFALAIAVVISLPLGIMGALNRSTKTDQATLFFSQIGIAIPNFWLGIMLALIFGRYLGVLPASGSVAFTEDPVQNIRHLILPGVSLGILAAAVLTRYMRSEMIDQLNKDYVTTARAFGHPKKRIVWKYTLKNALIPYVTMLGMQFGFLIGGVVVIETVFAYGGVGQLILNGLLNRDYPIVQMSLLILAGTFILVNLVVDIVYGYLNPRISY